MFLTEMLNCLKTILSKNIVFEKNIVWVLANIANANIVQNKLINKFVNLLFIYVVIHVFIGGNTAAEACARQIW